MLKNVVFIFGLVCASLGAHDIETLDAKVQSINSYHHLPCSKAHKKIITEIITSMANEGYWALFKKKSYMDRLGDQIEYKVHPLRFLGHVFSNPELKQCMVSIRRDMLKWRGFLGSQKRRGVVKNMTRAMHNNDLFQHLYGFSKHVNADYDRVLFYVEREDYEGMVKYLIKH